MDDQTLGADAILGNERRVACGMELATAVRKERVCGVLRETLAPASWDPLACASSLAHPHQGSVDVLEKLRQGEMDDCQRWRPTRDEICLAVGMSLYACCHWTT